MEPSPDQQAARDRIAAELAAAGFALPGTRTVRAYACGQPGGLTSATLECSAFRAHRKDRVMSCPRLATGHAPRRARAAVLTALAAAAVLTTGCGASPAATALQARLLSAADVPAGWSAVPTNPPAARTSAPCLPSLGTQPRGWTYQAAGFVEGTAIPTATEVLATGPQTQRTWRDLGRALARCRTATITIAGKKARATIRPLSLPHIATSRRSQATWPPPQPPQAS